MNTNTKHKFIDIEYPGFFVSLCEYGASVYSIKVNGKEMLSTFLNKDEWFDAPSYHGKTIGRVAGRIPNASIKFNNKEFKLEPNERENTLHGGFKGLSYKTFLSNVIDCGDHKEVTFSYFSPDMECGFPGNVIFVVIYKVYKNKTIEIVHLANSKVCTPVNLTQHLYFKLGEKDLSTINMYLKASKRFMLDDNLLKLEKCDVYNTSFDFTKSKPIMKDCFSKDVEGPHKNGFDDIWCIDEHNNEECIAVLESPSIKAEFYSNYDASVIYMDGYPSKKMLNTGIIDEQYSSITMELTNQDIQFIDENHPYNKFTKIQFKEIIDGKHS